MDPLPRAVKAAAAGDNRAELVIEVREWTRSSGQLCSRRGWAEVLRRGRGAARELEGPGEPTLRNGEESPLEEEVGGQQVAVGGGRGWRHSWGLGCRLQKGLA